MEIGKKYKTFENRIEAAELLVPLLQDLKDQNPLILAVPRGAIPMGRILATALNGELNILLVRKIRHPFHPELAIGAVTEFGDVIVTPPESLSSDEIERAALQEIQALEKKRARYTGQHKMVDVQGRTVVLVDDGVATGSTLAAGIRSLKSQGAHRIIVAVPVSSESAVSRLQAEGAEVRAYYVPQFFGAVSYFYKDFPQISDSEVGEFFRVQSVQVEIANGKEKYKAVLGKALSPKGFVLFVSGSSGGRLNPRNQYLADFLNRQGISTMLVDLLSEEESKDKSNTFDIQLLADRVLKFTEWIERSPEFRHLPLGYIGANTGAGAALRAVVVAGARVSAVVSRGGRPDLAGDILAKVQTPTLLLVGGKDHLVVDLNESAFRKLKAEKRMEVIPRASHLFEEPGTLQQVAELTADWFQKYFTQAQSRRMDLEPPIYP